MAEDPAMAFYRNEVRLYSRHLCQRVFFVPRHQSATSSPEAVCVFGMYLAAHLGALHRRARQNAAKHVQKYLDPSLTDALHIAGYVYAKKDYFTICPEAF